MGSKNEPGQWDCYANAEPDEPMFILLGRDPLAAALVEEWADTREGMIKIGKYPLSDIDKVREARQCAEKMRAWALKKGKRPHGRIRLGGKKNEEAA